MGFQNPILFKTYHDTFDSVFSYLLGWLMSRFKIVCLLLSCSCRKSKAPLLVGYRNKSLVGIENE
jgi:hypothetical protein